MNLSDLTAKDLLLGALIKGDDVWFRLILGAAMSIDTKRLKRTLDPWWEEQLKKDIAEVNSRYE